ncbi:unnamed protein product [Paramecium primaurelia]|uniref:SPRY domain-containing protein n=1 Tax=Paramecium primaurelia TaxID=5886 RepID=A0A8S1MQ17_PARPR|nr:unnamed protein product [Paramecium primaurelia]
MNFMMCKYHPENQVIFLLWNDSMLQFACEECSENQKKQENKQILKQLSIRKALKEPDYFLGEFNLNKENRQLIKQIENLPIQKLNSLMQTIDTCVKEIQISLSDLINKIKENILNIIQRKEKLRNNLEKISFYAQFTVVFQGLNSQKCLTDDVLNQIEDTIRQLFFEIDKNQNSFNQEVQKQLLLPKIEKINDSKQYQIFIKKLQNFKDSISPFLIQNTQDLIQYQQNYNKDLKFSNIHKQSQIQVSLEGKMAYAAEDVWQVVLCEQPIPQNRKISFYFNILQLHQFYCGICFKNLISKDYRGYVSNIGHGYYLMCRYGNIYSHHDNKINGQQKGFPSYNGDTIEIIVDMIEKTITWTNNRSKQSFKLTIQTIDTLYPCLRIAKSKVQILQC